MHLNTEDTGSLISKLDRMAIENGYGKIFAKIPATRWKAFKSAGYTKEAVVSKFFKGKTDGIFVAKYFSAERQKTRNQTCVDQMESNSNGYPRTKRITPPIIACTPSDAEEMGNLYRQVFESYPFPIHQPEYLKRMMGKNAFYFCIHVKKKIAAVAAAETDSASMTCEMTDFATLPEHRGKGLARKLLGRLDDEARKHGMKTAYTIARADSHGMNRVFKRKGYQYAGLLNNNSQICGSIRSMTVWYKHL
ncbi:MAG: putative beta-lysine N-acetyltransferase [Desulfosarcina sp.]|nr:putative beta-lysine N-acetyltransferase [Desulfosarcina sp.]